ncbi:hypothetical protein J6590_019140 [Homalodisca vitripennis]|nr:hypothetical protein J6590_019140 [Homalodisca vitripennis]
MQRCYSKKCFEGLCRVQFSTKERQKQCHFLTHPLSGHIDLHPLTLYHFLFSTVTYECDRCSRGVGQKHGDHENNLHPVYATRGHVCEQAPSSKMPATGYGYIDIGVDSVHPHMWERWVGGVHPILQTPQTLPASPSVNHPPYPSINTN